MALRFVQSQHRCSAINFILANANIKRFSSVPRVTLFTKKNCLLCDEAKEVILRYKNQIEYEEIDILCKDNKKWFDLYQFEIPVLHVNDKFVVNGHVDEKIMEKELGSI